MVSGNGICNGCTGKQLSKEMSKSDLFKERFDRKWKSAKDPLYRPQVSTRQSLRPRFEAELLRESESRARSNWCDAFSSFSNVNPKQALRNGAEKLSQTLYNVKTTFGVLSQKIKKSTKRRQPLVNLDSPKSPVTPYTRSKAALGRTPTKLYSPFSIDTPTGKENITCRAPKSKNCNSVRNSKKKVKGIKHDLGVSGISSSSSSTTPEIKLSNDLLQTQIGIYEFQSVANRIAQSSFTN